MKGFLRTLGHAALGGFAVGITAAVSNPGNPITLKTVLLPAGASALTSILSLFARSPLSDPGK